MELSGKVVFVLGAGFTRAFASNAPVLLVNENDLGLADLLDKYRGFENITKILNNAKDDNGDINVEQLLTRLSVGMPFDSVVMTEAERQCLLADIQISFFGLINTLTVDDDKKELLSRFANYLVENSVSCVTFNYDTLIDEYLWKVRSSITIQPTAVKYFHPDGGYGFFLRSAENLVRDINTVMDHCDSFIYKLHGSLNWRVKMGSKKPYLMEHLVHDENWLPTDGTFPKISDEDKSIHLEKAPFIIPPVLDKSEINEQSVLRVIWGSAFKKIIEADHVIFIGYSFPKTDIAARFLFKEALLGKVECIQVVSRTDTVKSSYREVFPQLNDEQFTTGGAYDWIAQNCVQAQAPVPSPVIPPVVPIVE